MVNAVQIRPRRGRQKEVALGLSGLRPRHVCPELIRAWLLDAEPVIFEGLTLVANELQPVRFVPGRNTVGLRQHPWSYIYETEYS